MNWLSLIVFLVVVFAVAAAGAAFTPGEWYEALSKPPWTPPNWLFAPAWTALYVMIAVSGWLVWQRVGASGAIVLFGWQLLLNADSVSARSTRESQYRTGAGRYRRAAPLDYRNDRRILADQPRRRRPDDSLCCLGRVRDCAQCVDLGPELTFTFKSQTTRALAMRYRTSLL